MGWYKVKIRPADKEFSNYIRERDGWKCRYGFRCSRNEDFSANKGGLDCSHFQKRRKETVRFDPENCDAACKACHHFVENDKMGESRLGSFKLEQLGTKRYNALLVRTNQTGKKDDVMARLQIKALIQELKQNATTTIHD